MTGHEGGLDQRPFIVLAIMFLAWLNYRGVLATLTFNLVITAIAFIAIIMMFLATSPLLGAGEMLHKDLMSGQASLPYGWLGILAAMHFGLWYYLGIEGHDAGGGGSALARAVFAVWHLGRDHDAADRGDADVVCLLGADAVGVSG